MIGLGILDSELYSDNTYTHKQGLYFLKGLADKFGTNSSEYTTAVDIYI